MTASRPHPLSRTFFLFAFVFFLLNSLLFMGRTALAGELEDLLRSPVTQNLQQLMTQLTPPEEKEFALEKRETPQNLSPTRSVMNSLDSSMTNEFNLVFQKYEHELSRIFDNLKSQPEISRETLETHLNLYQASLLMEFSLNNEAPPKIFLQRVETIITLIELHAIFSSEKHQKAISELIDLGLQILDMSLKLFGRNVDLALHIEQFGTNSFYFPYLTAFYHLYNTYQHQQRELATSGAILSAFEAHINSQITPSPEIPTIHLSELPEANFLHYLAFYYSTLGAVYNYLNTPEGGLNQVLKSTENTFTALKTVQKSILTEPSNPNGKQKELFATLSESLSFLSKTYSLLCNSASRSKMEREIIAIGLIIAPFASFSTNPSTLSINPSSIKKADLPKIEQMLLTLKKTLTAFLTTRKESTPPPEALPALELTIHLPSLETTPSPEGDLSPPLGILPSVIFMGSK